MTNGALRDIQQKMERALPYEAKDLFNYIERLKDELTRIAQFVRDDYRRRDRNEWHRAEAQIKQAFAVVGIDGDEMPMASEVRE